MPQERIGHYTIVSELGRGGMGVVYLAHEESLNRYVAIKVLSEQLSGDPSFVTRFTREAQAVAALSHPNIIQIFYIGEDGGRHYFVMEYVKGKSLLTMVKEQGRIENPRAAQYMLQAANGLAAAHDQGFLHRDIKPANLLVDERGLLKIADFGLALPQDAVTRLTATGMLVGTPGYLSPEQCMGETLDRRTDIYSLGVTFYELLTATMPFQADSPLALLRKILQEEPPDVATLNAQVDEKTRGIVNRMIAKDRSQRYQDCHQLAADLGEYLGGTAKIAGAAGVAAVAGAVASSRPLTGELNGATTRMPDSGAASVPPGKTKPVTVSPEAPAATPAPPQSAAASAATATPPPAAAVPAPSALVAAPQAMPIPAPVSPARRSRAPLVILAVLVVFLAAAAVAGFFALRSPLVKRFLPWASAARVSDQAARQPVGGTEGTSTAASTTQETGPANVAVPGATGQGRAVAAAGPATGAAVGESPGGSASAGVSHPAAPSRSAGRAASGSQAPPSRSARVGMSQPSAAAPGPAESAAPALAGVAVGATGERPIAEIVAGALQSELQASGLQPLDAATMPGTEDLFGGDGSPAVGELLRRLRDEGVARLVLARVEAAGQRELQYMDRSDVAYSSRVTVSCYDVATGRPRGRSLSVTFESTSLNQQQATEKAVSSLVEEILQQVR